MAERTRRHDSDRVAVIGLGRFGGQVADALVGLGHEVLAVDQDATRVDKWKERLTYVVQADATQVRVLRQLGIHEFSRVVVGLGSALDASVLTVLALAEIGVPEIWARSTSSRHSRILSAVGAQRVIFPEAAMGDRVAHLITTRLLDFTEFHASLAVAEIRAPRELHGRTVGESGLRQRYGVTVVAVQRPGEDFVFAGGDTVIAPDSVLAVAGRSAQLEHFAAVT
ncbi:MAG TPA: TrkA family potassium uptake protein [Micromonosporaceae bacterium]